MTHHTPVFHFSLSTFRFPLLALLLVFAACGKDEGGSNANPLQGNIDNPGWSVDPDYDYSISMTAVVSVHLQTDGQAWEVDSADCLAAFVGDECVGLAEPKGSLFFLYIVQPQSESSYAMVSLRYYSAQLRNVFVSDAAFPFVSGAQHGTAADPKRIDLGLFE